MTSTFTLHTVVPSRGSEVLWMLEECDADYRIVPLSLGAALKTPDYLAINPMGKVPALEHGDAVITETIAILGYLAELFPEKRLIPAAGSAERGQYYRWMCLALHLEYAGIDRWRGIENSPQQRTMIGYGDLETISNVLRQHLQRHPHIVGDHFSALDLYYSGLLRFLVQYIQVLPDEPVFTDFIARHRARPARARAEAKEKEIMPAGK